MRYLSVATAIALAAMVPPANAGQQFAEQVSDENLDIFVEALAPLEQGPEKCSNNSFDRWKARTTADPLEQRLPGVHDRMAAAAIAYCRAHRGELASEARRLIRDYWSRQLTVEERSRLAPLLRLIIEDRNAVQARLQSRGPADETARSIPQAAVQGRFSDAATAFTQTSSGWLLMNRFQDLQEESSRRFSESEGPFFTDPDGPGRRFVEAMEAEMRKAVNAHAVERGHKPIYPERP